MAALQENGLAAEQDPRTAGALRALPDPFTESDLDDLAQITVVRARPAREASFVGSRSKQSRGLKILNEP